MSDGYGRSFLLGIRWYGPLKVTDWWPARGVDR